MKVAFLTFGDWNETLVFPEMIGNRNDLTNYISTSKGLVCSAVLITHSRERNVNEKLHSQHLGTGNGKEKFIPNLREWEFLLTM